MEGKKLAKFFIQFIIPIKNRAALYIGSRIQENNKKPN